MTDEIITPQEGMNPEPEVVEVTEAVEENLEETVPKSQFNQVLARAKRAEEALKKDNKSTTRTTNNPDLSDELKLIARGLSDEEIEQAKIVAKGKGIPLTEAIKDPLFTIYQNNLKEEEKKEFAKLGASRGSGESQDESLIRPDMTREEHMKAFNEVMGH